MPPCPRTRRSPPRGSFNCPRRRSLLLPTTAVESALLQVFILNNLNPFRMNTYKKQAEGAHFAHFWCNVSPFRMNTSKTVSKQITLTPFRINTYEKRGEGGPYFLLPPAEQGYLLTSLLPVARPERGYLRTSSQRKQRRLYRRRIRNRFQLRIMLPQRLRHF